MIVSIEADDSGWERVPALEELTHAAIAAAALASGRDNENLETAILFTSDDAVAELNLKWRGKTGATNVLSFPAEDFPVPEGEARPIGDMVLAAGVVAREAAEQGKTLPQHVSHLIIHGFLHLIGYDHQSDREAKAMEELEAAIMKGLGFPGPYERQ